MYKFSNILFESNKPFKQIRFILFPTITLYHKQLTNAHKISIRFEWFRFYYGICIYYFENKKTNIC